MKKICLLLSVLSTWIIGTAQQKVIPLYQGTAPGSENWTWQEKETGNTPMKMRILYNVTQPSLTVFPAPAAIATGTSIIICPGGGYHVLNIDREGFDVARELNKKGITAFVFKYRVAQSFTDDPWQEMMSIFRDTAARNPRVRQPITMAKEDIVVAMQYVRNHVAEYKLDSNKIGIIGFSAGGTLARQLASQYTRGTRPAFAGVIYTGIDANANLQVPEDAPPLFIAAATDDVLLPVMKNIELYKAWQAAKRSVELHLYATGGHGLRGTPADTWIYRFEEWLAAQGFPKR